jgi:hypothetical protein
MPGNSTTTRINASVARKRVPPDVPIASRKAIAKMTIGTTARKVAIDAGAMIAFR